MSRSIGVNEPATNETIKTVEVSQSEYDEMLRRGFSENEILQPGVHKFRRVKRERLASPYDLKPANIKVQITMKIDLDVLEHFKKRAAEPNAAPYQTQINAELREIMERDLIKDKEAIDATVKELLKNDDFLEALTEKLRLKK